LLGLKAAVDGLIDDFHTCGYGLIDLELDPLRVATEIAVAAAMSVLLSDRKTWDSRAMVVVSACDQLMPVSMKDDHATRGIAIGIALMLLREEALTRGE
jgi:hypothetical protein